MALHFEGLQDVEREQARTAVARSRATWDKTTELGRMLAATAEVIGATREEYEQQVMEVGREADQAANRDARLRAARRGWTRLDECYKRLEVSAKYGLQTSERMFDNRTEVAGMSEEEERKLKRVLKQIEEETKEKTGKKRGREETDEGNRGSGNNQMVSGNNTFQFPAQGGCMYGQQGAGMAGPSPPWFWDQSPYPYNCSTGWPGFGGQPSYGGPGGFTGQPYGQPGIMSQQSAMFQQGGAATVAGGVEGAMSGGSVGAPVKKKNMCINCGGNDHWSYNPICPNFAIHLQQLQAKSESMRKSGGGGAGDRTVALRDKSGN